MVIITNAHYKENGKSEPDVLGAKIAIKVIQSGWENEEKESAEWECAYIGVLLRHFNLRATDAPLLIIY